MLVKLLYKCFIRVQNWEKLSFERKGSSLQSDVVEPKGSLLAALHHRLAMEEEVKS